MCTNYTTKRIGDFLGRDHKTIKRWCGDLAINVDAIGWEDLYRILARDSKGESELFSFGGWGFRCVTCLTYHSCPSNDMIGKAANVYWLVRYWLSRPVNVVYFGARMDLRTVRDLSVQFRARYPSVKLFVEPAAFRIGELNGVVDESLTVDRLPERVGAEHASFKARIQNGNL